MKQEELRLTDTAIGHIAQLLQVAILTGTDIIDNLRTAKFVTRDGTIEVSPDWSESFQSNIQKMMEEANQALENKESTEEETL